jgi:hypothetical protein
MASALRKIANRIQALSPKESALAEQMAEAILLNVRDLGDERAVVLALLRNIPNEDLPRPVLDRLFDPALDRARALRQARTQF